MTKTANATQLNKYPYLRMPLGLPKLAASAVLLVSEVFSFTGKDRHGNDLTCNRTYQSFKERIGKPHATVGRAIKAATEEKLIKRDKEKGFVFELENFPDVGFLRCPQFITSEVFKIRKKKRKLLANEVRVYAYLFTHCDNRKNADKVCITSYAQIAEALNLNEKTVYKAIWSLLRAKLIYRPKKDKGVNGYRLSRYTLNVDILRKHGVLLVEEQEHVAVADNNAAASEWTKERIEQYYYDKQERAKLIAERNLIRARQNERFKLADDIYKAMSIQAAVAPFQEPDKAQEYERRAAKAKSERLIALKELGLTEKDLEPQYKCKACNDTGYRIDTGQRCKCFPPGKGV